MAINPTVAATATAIGNGLTLSVSRPGAEDSTGVLFVVAVAFLGDAGSAGTIVAGSAGFTGLGGFAYNRMSTYGRYVGVRLYAKTGVATEAATFDITWPGTAADTVLSATAYRITDPASATETENRGATTGTSSAISSVTWGALTMQATDSVVIHCGAMFSTSSSGASSLGLKSGATSVIQHQDDSSGSTVYWLRGVHGYHPNVSGSLGSNSDTLTGNLGCYVYSMEIKGSASSGGGGGGSGARVIYIGD